MTKLCRDCEYATCGRLHDYDPHACELSDGKPCQECFQMGFLDAQISSVHSQLVQLAQKRHALKAKINQRHEPFIHLLPLAVSSEIFTYYVHHVSDTFDPKNASKSIYARDWSESPAFFLSSICATWRRIAFATPEIWRSINIPLLGYNPDVDLKIKLLNGCVDRAARRSLFIGVGAVIQFHPDLADRLEEITLWGLPPHALQLILPEDGPNLVAVRIAEAFREDDDDDAPVGPGGWHTGNISLQSRALRKLDMTFASELLDDSSIAWDNITTMRMSGLDVSNAVDILRQARRLVSASFVFEGIGCKPPKTPITNSALKELHIESSSAVVMKAFASSVTLPSLCDLSLQKQVFPIRESKSLFERSQCQCRVRTPLSLLLLAYTSDDDISKLLQILPSVEDLTLESPSHHPLSPGNLTYTNKFFETLRHPHFNASSSGRIFTDPPVLLPKLKSLSYMGPMHFTWPAFLEMFPPQLERPLSRVSLKLKNPHDFTVVFPRIHQIQQSNIALIVVDLRGDDFAPGLQQSIRVV